MASAHGSFLIMAETRLREAQMADSLNSVRRTIKTKMSTKEFTRRNLHGQRSATKSRSTLKRIDKKIKEHADRYRRGYFAMLTLDPNGEWTSTFRQLDKDDLRQPLRNKRKHADTDSGSGSDRQSVRAQSSARAQAQERLGEGHKTVSWIWSKGIDGVEEDDGE